MTCGGGVGGSAFLKGIGVLSSFSCMETRSSWTGTAQRRYDICVLEYASCVTTTSMTSSILSHRQRADYLDILTPATSGHMSRSQPEKPELRT